MVVENLRRGVTVAVLGANVCADHYQEPRAVGMAKVARLGRQVRMLKHGREPLCKFRRVLTFDRIR